MLPLPAFTDDYIQLADWLELAALTAADENASAGDLERGLRRTGIPDADIERTIAAVFDELWERETASAGRYPFSIQEQSIAVRGTWRTAPCYVFCLCLSYLSYLGNKVRSKGGPFPDRLFEDVARAAAKSYVSGRAVRFAWPRTDLPRAFDKALTSLCRDYIREGLGFRPQPPLSRKDGGLDVVAWRDFPDAAPGKLLLFGACASGKDWVDKVSELQPQAFCQQWMIEQPVSPLAKAFFVPHRVDRSHWSFYSRHAGIIFDRCRIAAYTAEPANGDQGYDVDQCLAWTDKMLAQSTSL